MSRPAVTDFDCIRCGRQVHRGDTIEFYGNGWGHIDCDGQGGVREPRQPRLRPPEHEAADKTNAG